ncbi:hypothetical protein [Paenibacillus sp. B1-33]|uniref:hypothetical protein n=1 Tax=unclassified Paenibacillus TaxID=185978 RepID=UPI003D2CB254
MPSKLIFSDRVSLERAAEWPAKLGTVLDSLAGTKRAYLWMGTGEVSCDRILANNGYKRLVNTTGYKTKAT